MSCGKSDALMAAWDRAESLALVPGEPAEWLAGVWSSGGVDSALLAEWSRVTGMPRHEFEARGGVGSAWQSAATPGLRRLIQADPERASEYAGALADLAAAAASVEPLDLRRVNSAAFMAAAQLRALAPAHGLMPPASIGHIRDALAQADAVPTPASLAPEGTAAAEADSSEPLESYEDLLEELDGLVGLSRVKSEVRQQAELLRVARLRSDRGLKNPDITRHLVFTGNPGTGKTTVARLVSRIYRSLGLLERGHLVEVDRAGLVGGFLGQTESRTAQVVESAIGGVLFIDEAYALAGDQYGDAAVAVLVKAIEDHRDDLVLIVAGYTGRMAEFLGINPGLASRLRLTVEFPDYSEDELAEIFQRLCASSDYEPTDGAVSALRELVRAERRDETFGNARFVRNCFEAALVRQAWRLREVREPSESELRALDASDLGGA